MKAKKEYQIQEERKKGAQISVKKFITNRSVKGA